MNAAWPDGHFIEHGAEAEKIGAGVEIFAASLFRRHVGDGADGRAGTGEKQMVGGGLVTELPMPTVSAMRRDGGLFGQAEIENFCLSARR